MVCYCLKHTHEYIEQNPLDFWKVKLNDYCTEIADVLVNTEEMSKVIKPVYL